MTYFSPTRTLRSSSSATDQLQGFINISNPTTSSDCCIEEINSLLTRTETKSVEQALIPLIANLQKLFNAKRLRDDPANSRRSSASTSTTAQLLADTGAWVARAADQFADAGHRVAADAPPRLAEAIDAACCDAATAGRAVARLTQSSSFSAAASSIEFDGDGIRAAACRLVWAVTRAMVLADRLNLQQLLASCERASNCLDDLAGCSRFADFMPAFAGLGEHLVLLGRLSGERQADLKCETARCRLAHTRSALEKALPLLLAASKLRLRHPENRCAQQLRDEAFAHTRRCLAALAEAAQPAVLTALLARLRRHQLPPRADERRRLASQAGLIAEAVEAADAAPTGANYNWRRLEAAWRGCVAACGMAARLPTDDDCWTAGADWLEYHLQALGSMLLIAARAHDLLAPESRITVACFGIHRDAWKSVITNEFGHLLLTVIYHLEVADAEPEASASAQRPADEVSPRVSPQAVRCYSPEGYENVTQPFPPAVQRLHQDSSR